LTTDFDLLLSLSIERFGNTQRAAVRSVSFYLHAFPAGAKVSVPLFGRRFRSRSKVVAGFASYGTRRTRRCAAPIHQMKPGQKGIKQDLYISNKFWLCVSGLLCFIPPKARAAMRMQAFLAAQRRW